jgi:SAM-dependent methyltransferase
MGLFSPVIREYLGRVSHYARGCLLDVGCGAKPYRQVFGNVSRYIGIDRPAAQGARTNSAPDVLAGADAIPFANETFDTVLATQVLEHLPDPGAFLRDACRVLKTGGSLILTFPHVSPLHEEPRDYYRYTEHGSRHLCEVSGFQMRELIPMGGGWLTVGYLIREMLCRNAGTAPKSARQRLEHSLGVFLYTRLAAMDARRPHPELPLNYLLVATKRGGTQAADVRLGEERAC